MQLLGYDISERSENCTHIDQIHSITAPMNVVLVAYNEN
jgi:hypothetical protein